MDEKDFKTFFYKGLPYKKLYIKDNQVSGYCIWQKSNYINIPLSEINICETRDIENIFINNCKEAIKSYLIGWTMEQANQLEKEGRDYIMNYINGWISLCPFHLYEACKKGKYGVILSLSYIALPDELQMNKRFCSDNIVRNDINEYIKYILGTDFNLIELFKKEYPYLKFEYYKYNENNLIQDIVCYVPFYGEADKIDESVLL